MTKKVNLEDNNDGVGKVMLEKHKKQKIPSITNSNSNSNSNANSRPSTSGNNSRPTTAK